MFMGRYNHTIDPKGRLSIPSKYREILGDEFVVSKGMDGCLFVYANEDWKVFEAKLASLPLINQEARQFARFFLSGAQYVTVDKQGRILMPQDLREFAGLEKDVVLAGMGGRQSGGYQSDFPGYDKSWINDLRRKDADGI